MRIEEKATSVEFLRDSHSFTIPDSEERRKRYGSVGRRVQFLNLQHEISYISMFEFFLSR